jgi:hypothetical protein
MDSSDLALSFGSALLTGVDERTAKELTEHLIDNTDAILAQLDAA